MQAQDQECHIVNTTSVYGIFPSGGAYGVSKFGITALSEILRQELEYTKSKIKVSILIPAAVNTNIINSERNRPEKFKNDPNEERIDPEIRKWLEDSKAQYEVIFKKGMNPDVVANMVFQGIREQKFYIFTDKTIKIAIKKRNRLILKDMDLVPNY